MIVVVVLLAAWPVLLVANARLHHPRARMLAVPRLQLAACGRHRAQPPREEIVLRIGQPPAGVIA